MAGPNAKKRSHQEFSVKNRLKAQRPLKKKKQKAYHSDSDEDENDNANFKPVNLQDSDEEEASHAVVAHDDSSSDSNSDSDPGADSDGEASGRQKLKPKRQKPAAKAQPKPKAAKKVEKEEEKEVASNSGEDNDDDDDEDDDEDDLDENDEFDISAGDESDADAAENGGKKAKSKRNDPSAFSNSLHKILSTKLATTRRADPLLSRSADAHKAAQAITDEQLESKAKRKLRQERLAALEKGRVRDVLVAPTNDQGQIEASTGQILEKEKQLRKVAQRGVIKLFNAVRAAQIKSVEAERETRQQGFVGVKNREEKVTEMSRKGFLDLIANSGGGLKKGPVEEA